MHKLFLAALSALLLSHCSQKQPAPAVAATSAQLTFIEDNYEHARALASERKLPLFVDVWASWCHTCLSMKQYVLTDPAITSLAGSFVWLSIDSERKDNAAFLQRFPSRNLPTLWVIDAATQAPLLKWIGAATAGELRGVLSDSLQLQPGAADTAELDTLWLRAQHASAEGNADKAISLYRRVLELAPAAWPRRARTVEALSMRLVEAKQSAAVVELAQREAPGMQTSTARLNVVLNGIDAAAELAPDAPERAALPALIELGTKLAETPTASVLLDDRSSLYLSLIEAQKRSSPQEARRLAAALSQALDEQASKERDAARRRVWDPHRVEAYLALEELGDKGAAARAIPLLEQSEREAPTDYNAPARLARVYYVLQRLPEARAAIDRALPLAAGPRKLRLSMLKSDILLAAGDKDGARSALRDALEFAKSAQLSAQYDKQRSAIEQRLREL